MPSEAPQSGLQPQGQATSWREAHDHPSLPSPLTRWGLFSNCDFICNYCLHTDAASHRKGKYTMSQIITWGLARVGLSWKHEDPPAPTALLLQGAAAGSKVLGLPCLYGGSPGFKSMGMKAPGPSRATSTHRHPGLLSLAREIRGGKQVCNCSWSTQALGRPWLGPQLPRKHMVTGF